MTWGAWVLEGWQLGKVMREIRRAMSVTIVGANALCLLNRLSKLGPGARAAARRRQETLRLEERRRRDREAFDMVWHARGSSELVALLFHDFD